MPYLQAVLVGAWQAGSWGRGGGRGDCAYGCGCATLMAGGRQ